MKHSIHKRFGDIIRKERMNLGLSQEKLAEKAGVHRTYIGMIERGEQNITITNIEKIAEAVEISMSRLFSEIDKHNISEIMKQSNDLSPSHSAEYTGVLKLEDNEIDCYVLNTTDRVISFRDVLKAIANRDGGNVAEYIGVEALKPYINKNLLVAGIIHFSIPGLPSTAKGLKAESFIDICRGYVKALSENALMIARQKEIAFKCSILLASFAKVGLIALIDEATGYRDVLNNDRYKRKIKSFIAAEMRKWEKTFLMNYVKNLAK